MKIRKITTLLLTVAMVVLASVSAFAVGAIETDKDCTLTLNYKDGETPLKGASFDLYKVAEVSPYVDFTVSSQFEPYADSIKMDDLDQDGWNALAVTLAGYVAKDQLAPVSSAITDENGQAKFPAEGAEMKPGMYLVVGKRIEQGGYSYTSIPTMVFLPKNDLDTNAWVYDETINPKPERVPIADNENKINLKALKVWENDDAATRPESITVTLIKDGEAYDTQTLTADNNWRCEWYWLDGASVWQLAEDVPEGYTVSIERNGITFVVTNTAKPTTPEEEPPVDIDEPPVPLDGGEPPEDFEELPEDPVPLAGLPQTGLLWWPVGLMAAAGLLCLTIGVYRRRSC